MSMAVFLFVQPRCRWYIVRLEQLYLVRRWLVFPLVDAHQKEQ